MDHARLITALALESYADRTASKAILPELIRKLVVASCQDLARCDIQDADHINRPGFDALIEAQRGRPPFVPSGRSYWEISNQGDSKEKATKDLEKRTAQVPAPQRSHCAFVFATLREWGPAKIEAWVSQHSDKGWRELVVLDSSQFSDWLRELPPVARWLQAQIDPTKSPSGWRDASEYWDRLCQERKVGYPLLPPGVFLQGRGEAASKLQALFEGDDNLLYVGAAANSDVRDFVAAFIAIQDAERKANWSGRCVFVDSRDAWSAVAALPKRLVLVGDTSLGLDSDGDYLRREATQAGHAVVVPLRSGSQTAGSFCQLVNPGIAELEKELLEAGYLPDQAKAILGDGFTSLSVLKSRFVDRLIIPVYGDAKSRRWMALAGLAGAWQEAFGQDLVAVAEILGIVTEEWKSEVLPDLASAGSPIVCKDGVWRFSARREAWQTLGGALFDDDLKRLEAVAIRVLGEADPALEVEKSERWMATTAFGKRRNYSDQLRHALVETLALLGSSAGALGRLSVGRAQLVADRAVRELLNGATAHRWLSVHDLLPGMAEASPEEFLAAVEQSLAKANGSPFAEVFQQEDGGPLGRTYISGLLWGLETLAWSPSYFARVVLALADLAAIDPGGRWGNRPLNSLTTLLLPWLPQTVATVALRESALRAMAKEQPSIAWKVLLSLLPDSISSSSGCRKPEWRADLMAGWTSGVSREDYIEQFETYCQLAMQFAANDVERLGELVQVIHRLHPDARDVLLDQLIPTLTLRPEGEIVVVWEEMVAIASRHRRYQGATWATPSEEVEKLERAAAMIEPKDPALRHRRLFSERSFFEEEKVGWQEQERRLGERRAAALREILPSHELAPILPMIEAVKQPYQLGYTVGGMDREGDDAQILPRMLTEERVSCQSFVAGFVWGRWQKGGAAWVDSLDTSTWTAKLVATLCALLPFTLETWQRVEESGEEPAQAYWTLVAPHPWGVEDPAGAASRLLAAGRPQLALNICGVAVMAGRAMDSVLAVKVLRACIAKASSPDRLDAEAAQGLIAWLQDQGDADQAALFEIEWAFIGLLDRIRGVGPKTIEARLAADPGLFCEAIRLVFRSEKESERAALVESEERRQLLSATYRLLHGMEALPGRRADGVFDGVAFKEWLAEVRRLSDDTGHLQGALIQVGQMLARAAKADDWFVAMPEVAEALNAKDADKMRREFRTQLYNSRGIYSPSKGQEERALADRFERQAQGLESRGWIRVATTLRDLVRVYGQEAAQAAMDGKENG